MQHCNTISCTYSYSNLEKTCKKKPNDTGVSVKLNQNKYNTRHLFQENIRTKEFSSGNQDGHFRPFKKARGAIHGTGQVYGKGKNKTKHGTSSFSKAKNKSFLLNKQNSCLEFMEKYLCLTAKQYHGAAHKNRFNIIS